MSSICAECGSQVLDLKSHLKIHKDSKVECEVCGKDAACEKASLPCHVTVYHRETAACHPVFPISGCCEKKGQ